MNLESLGHAAGVYQRDPRLIKAGLQVVQGKYEAVPALTLNGIAYFHVNEIVSAIGWLASNDARAAAKKEKEAAGDE